MKINFFFLFINFICSSVFAADVTININGGILAQSCNVTSKDLVKNINFLDLNPSDFDQIGTTSALEPLSIHLLNCTGKVNSMSYKFSGEADDSDSTLLKVLGQANNLEENIATGLAIEILNKSKSKISLNTNYPLNEIITASSYDLNFYLRYKSTQAEVGPGDASSLLFLDIYYE